jgi:hypothetical protein
MAFARETQGVPEPPAGAPQPPPEEPAKQEPGEAERAKARAKIWTPPGT